VVLQDARWVRRGRKRSPPIQTKPRRQAVKEGRRRNTNYELAIESAPVTDKKKPKGEKTGHGRKGMGVQKDFMHPDGQVWIPREKKWGGKKSRTGRRQQQDGDGFRNTKNFPELGGVGGGGVAHEGEVGQSNGIVEKIRRPIAGR